MTLYPNDPMLAAYEPEEWQWWIEELMLTGKHLRIGKFWEPFCLFCKITGECKDCMGIIPPHCLSKYSTSSDRYFAGWDRLRRAGIL